MEEDFGPNRLAFCFASGPSLHSLSYASARPLETICRRLQRLSTGEGVEPILSNQRSAKPLLQHRESTIRCQPQASSTRRSWTHTESLPAGAMRQSSEPWGPGRSVHGYW